MQPASVRGTAADCMNTNKKFVAFQRHSLAEAQTAEVQALGFVSATTAVVTFPVDKAGLEKVLTDAGLGAGDGVTFVAPPLIALRLTEAAKEKGIRVFLPESKPDPTKRAKTEFPAETTESVRQFALAQLKNSVEVNGEGKLFALGQMPFVHLRFTEV
ncbi:MAG: hypothetical protein HYS57_00365 [Parcubacteria group bacterium]|nr:hypothetical protein [Parcubacteria group bacterium]